jgi:hypothetical protein
MSWRTGSHKMHAHEVYYLETNAYETHARHTRDTPMRYYQQQDRLKVVSDYLYVQDAMYSSYTLILLIVMTHCCLHSRYRNRQGRYL